MFTSSADPSSARRSVNSDGSARPAVQSQGCSTPVRAEGTHRKVTEGVDHQSASQRVVVRESLSGALYCRKMDRKGATCISTRELASDYKASVTDR